MKLDARQGEILRAALVVGVAVALALLTGEWLLAALAGSLLYLAWHLLQLLRLRRLLAAGERLREPFPGGLWRSVYESIRRTQTRTRKARRRLSRFAGRFRDAASAFPEAVILLDRHLVVQWCNAAGRELFDLGSDRADRSLANLVNDPLLTEYLEKRDFSRPLMIPSPVDKAKILGLRLSPFGRKKRDQYVLVASDVTRIYHLDVSRRDFVANVSHELRSPLTVITGYLEALVEALGDDEQWGRSLEQMQQQAQRMRDMIRDLLLLSKLEGDAEIKRDARVAVADLVSAIVGEARALAAGSRHRFTVQADPLLMLLGNRDELRSAFSNLVFNAVLHTPAGTPIEVRWESAGDGGARLVVADEGPGIAARHLSRLTERFYRVDPARSRRSGGTGLGLAIAKHVLQVHGGALEIASEVGRGTTVTCRLPASVVVADEAPRATAASVPE